MTGIPLATYRVQVNWWKKIGVADSAPLWTANDWTSQVAGNGLPTGAYVDLTPYLDLGRLPITITRGKTGVLGAVAAGSALVTLGQDEQNVFDPTNSSSPLASPTNYLLPYAGMKITASFDPGTGPQTYPLFTGWTTRIRAHLSKRGQVVIPAVDLFDRLQAHTSVGVLTPGSGSTATVISILLADLPGGWPYQDLDFGVGLPTATSLIQAQGSSLLDAISTFTAPSLGTFFIANDGTARFRNVGASNHGGSTIATVTNTMTVQEPEVDISNVYNWAIATKTKSSDSNYKPIPQVAKDQSSIDRYGKRVWELSSDWWATDSAALVASNYILSHYKNPFTHVRTITLEGREQADLDTILKVDVNDRVQVVEGQTGTSALYTVLGLSHTIGGQPFKHSVTWTIAPAGYS